MLWGALLGFYARVLVLLISVGITGSTVINRTIDDEFGDLVTGEKPNFLPTTGGIWEGQECGGCGVQPDRDDAFMGTWNAATFRPEAGGSGPISIDLSFKGTGIYVYFITGNQIHGGAVTTETQCNFTLDGQHAGFFQHLPDQTTEMNYNVLAFSGTNLQNINHTLRVSTDGVDRHIYVNFDYAVYTSDDETPPAPAASPSSPGSLIKSFDNPKITSKISSPTSPTFVASSTTTLVPGHRPVPLSIILGGSIGGSVLALNVFVLLLVCFRKRKQQKMLESASVMDSSAQGRAQGLHNSQTLSLSWHKHVPSRPRFTQSALEGLAPVVHGTLHTQQMHLEHQLREAERGLRAIGIEPQLGPPSLNTSFTVRQTGTYTDSVRLQGESEEPPPEYSRG